MSLQYQLSHNTLKYIYGYQLKLCGYSKIHKLGYHTKNWPQKMGVTQPRIIGQ